MAEELKNIIKEYTDPKFKEGPFLYIEVRSAKKVEDLLVKNPGPGIVELRVHTSNEKLPKWYLHAYLIRLRSLNFKVTDKKSLRKLSKAEITSKLMDPMSITNPTIKKLIQTLQKKYGDISPNGSNKLYWKTEKFKIKKDSFSVKRKAL